MTMGTRSTLPTGIQTFRHVREGGYRYVDKTPFALEVCNGDKHLFLSRPRRFGKSLLVDMLADFYEGREELFRGLAIHDQRDWTKRHPVLRLDFGGGNLANPDTLREAANAELDVFGADADVDVPYRAPDLRLRYLLRAAHQKAKRPVVVLVDEYDKPILDALDDPEIADANRRFLRGLYGAIKAGDRHIEKSFVTGVSRFSKTGLFSVANQFTDITFDPRYNAVCGFTQAEFDRTFAPELELFDRGEVRRWYNGYSWDGDPKAETVYNPYDVLKLFSDAKGRFRNYWYETGTPLFLVDELSKHPPLDLARLDGLWADQEALSAFDIERVEPAALLFQTGYLTVKAERSGAGDTEYRLGYPNEEVHRSVGRVLMSRIEPSEEARSALAAGLEKAVAAGDAAGLEETLRMLYAGRAHQQMRHIDRYEGTYSQFADILATATRLDSRCEESTAQGRADLFLTDGNNAFLLEYKMADEAGRVTAVAAIAQIVEKGYALKHLPEYGSRLHLAGVVMGPETRNIQDFAAGSAVELVRAYERNGRRLNDGIPR